MADNHLTYGFLTTYNQTLFFKRDREETNLVLYMSNIIHHSTRSQDVIGGGRRNEDFYGRVSLRECFLYFFWLGKDGGNWQVGRGGRMTRSAWVRNSKPRSAPDPAHPMGRRSQGGPGSSGGAGPSSAGGKNTSHGQGLGGNYQQSIGDPNAYLRVKWDPKARTFLFRKTADPSQICPVDKWKNENGTIIVLAEGRRQRAQVIVPQGPMRRK